MTKFIQTKALIKVDSQAEVKENMFDSQKYWKVKSEEKHLIPQTKNFIKMSLKQIN